MVDRDNTHTALRLALGLLLTPCAASLVAAVFSDSNVPERVANALVFAGGGLLPVVGLAIAATYQARLPFALWLAATCTLAGVALTHVLHAPLAAALIVDFSLVALAWAVGSSLGRRVQHASHLLPACVVAACADLVSVLSPEGPSHAIAQSDRALSLFATWFPEPGAHALAPALGVGDLLFLGLVFGVARGHALPYVRVALLCLLGTALAGVLAAASGVAVPALPTIALCVLVGTPAARQLRAVDRRAAGWAMAIACAAALAAVLRNVLLRR